MSLKSELKNGAIVETRNGKTKSELKNGAVVETRGGKMYVKVDGTLLNINMSGECVRLYDYSEDLKYISEVLKYKNSKNLDIVKVNNNTINCFGCRNNAILEAKRNIWTWERPKEILDEEEKEYLSAVIKPFRDEVKYIIKRNFIGDDKYNFCICLIDNFMNSPFISLYFKNDKIYKNMELNKNYTRAELGL